MEEKELKKIENHPSKNLKIILNLVDTLIAGKRFAEMDSKKQMYLMGCQTKIREMEEGYFDENGIHFIWNTINRLIHQLSEARDELTSITKRLEENKDEFVQ